MLEKKTVAKINPPAVNLFDSNKFFTTLQFLQSLSDDFGSIQWIIAPS